MFPCIFRVSFPGALYHVRVININEAPAEILSFLFYQVVSESNKDAKQPKKTFTIQV